MITNHSYGTVSGSPLRTSFRPIIGMSQTKPGVKGYNNKKNKERKKNEETEKVTTR
jgi:hypothetical protein